MNRLKIIVKITKINAENSKLWSRYENEILYTLRYRSG